MGHSEEDEASFLVLEDTPYEDVATPYNQHEIYEDFFVYNAYLYTSYWCAPKSHEPVDI